jgi:hypothetical protein
VKISERTIKPLGKIITGDSGISPYRSGLDLVAFFNEYGTNHQHGAGFPSRWMFAENCIRELNGSPAMNAAILGAIDPRHFASERAFDKISQERKPVPVQAAVAYLNQFLPFDGYEIVPHGHTYVLIDTASGSTVIEAANRTQRAFTRIRARTGIKEPGQIFERRLRRGDYQCSVIG